MCGQTKAAASRQARVPLEREFLIDRPPVRIDFIIEMVWWTGLAPWRFEPPPPTPLPGRRETLLHFLRFLYLQQRPDSGPGLLKRSKFPRIRPPTFLQARHHSDMRSQRAMPRVQKSLSYPRGGNKIEKRGKYRNRQTLPGLKGLLYCPGK